MLTSSFIDPWNLTGLSVLQKNVFMALRRTGCVAAVEQIPPTKSPPCDIATVSAFVAIRNSTIAENTESRSSMSIQSSLSPFRHLKLNSL